MFSSLFLTFGSAVYYRKSTLESDAHFSSVHTEAADQVPIKELFGGQRRPKSTSRKRVRKQKVEGPTVYEPKTRAAKTRVAAARR